MKISRQQVGIGDVAEMCGVGIATVSKVLNNKQDVAKKTREAVLKAIRESGYIPSAAARRLRSGSPFEKVPTQTIEMVVHPIMRKFLYWNQLIWDLIEEAKGLGYNLILTLPSENSTRRGVDGMILTTEDCENATGQPPKTNTPCVTVDYFADDPGISGVMVDYEGGIYEATKTALQRGYKNPLLLGQSGKGESQYSFSKMMIRGFTRAWNEAGHNSVDAHIYGEKIYTLEMGYKAGKKILSKENHPDLLIANDDAGMGIYKAAGELGINIPNQLGVIGCDGAYVAEFLHPSLATIRIGFNKLAKEILSRLVCAINGTSGPYPQKLIMETSFKDGGSIKGDRPK